MTEFQIGDVIYGVTRTDKWVAVITETEVVGSSGYRVQENDTGRFGIFFEEELTLIGGPRMVFKPGDIVDVAKGTTTINDEVSMAAGRRVVVHDDSSLASIGETPVELNGLPYGFPLTSGLTLVKREGYVDRTEKDNGTINTSDLSSNLTKTLTVNFSEYNPGVLKLLFGEDVMNEVGEDVMKEPDCEEIEVPSLEEEFLNHVSGQTEDFGVWSAPTTDENDVEVLHYSVENGPVYRVWVERL